MLLYDYGMRHFDATPYDISRHLLMLSPMIG